MFLGLCFSILAAAQQPMDEGRRWTFDAATGNNAAWTNGVGSGALSSAGHAGMGQGRQEGSDARELPILRLSITNAMNSFSDETVVVFDQGTPLFDPFMDAQQFVFAHPQAPQIATRSSDGVNISIDFYGQYDADIIIPLVVNAGVTGDHTITPTISGMNNLSCLTLEDMQTGTVTALTNGSGYTFSMNADDDPAIPRFRLHASAPIPLMVQHVTCTGMANGLATLELGETSAAVTWMTAGGQVILEQAAMTGQCALGGLPGGEYQVMVAIGSACANLMASFTIDQPLVALDAMILSVDGASCQNTNDGFVNVQVYGGSAPYQYLWSNNSTAEDLTAGPGEYTLTVTDANNCVWSSGGLNIMGGALPSAAIVPPLEPVIAGFSCIMQALPADDASYYWDMGDGSTAMGMVVEHTYPMPGTYTVLLTVDDGICSDTSSRDIQVELSTGIAEGGLDNGLRAWCVGGMLNIHHASRQASDIDIELISASGQRVRTIRSSPLTPVALMPLHDLVNGVYFVRVHEHDGQRVIRIPVLH